MKSWHLHKQTGVRVVEHAGEKLKKFGYKVACVESDPHRLKLKGGLEISEGSGNWVGNPLRSHMVGMVSTGSLTRLVCTTWTEYIIGGVTRGLQSKLARGKAENPQIAKQGVKKSAKIADFTTYIRVSKLQSHGHTDY